MDRANEFFAFGPREKWEGAKRWKEGGGEQSLSSNVRSHLYTPLHCTTLHYALKLIQIPSSNFLTSAFLKMNKDSIFALND